MSPNSRDSRPRPEMQPAAFGGFAISGSWRRGPPRIAAPDCADWVSVAHHVARRNRAGKTGKKAIPNAGQGRIGEVLRHRRHDPRQRDAPAADRHQHDRGHVVGAAHNHSPAPVAQRAQEAEAPR